jgi:hypothetical protein
MMLIHKHHDVNPGVVFAHFRKLLEVSPDDHWLRMALASSSVFSGAPRSATRARPRQNY